MTMKRITLRLGRNEGYPEGDPRQGYIIHAPLAADGSIDLEGWRDNRSACVVQRLHFDPDERADGWLTHSGNHWRIRYDEEYEGPDEPAHRLGDHKFTPGEYVTFAHRGEEPLVYKVMEVAPL